MPRLNRMVVLARYHETETQIPRPQSLLRLRLPARMLRGIRGIPLTATFLATDASGETRKLTRTIVLR
jgi:hypothetical protein